MAAKQVLHLGCLHFAMVCLWGIGFRSRNIVREKRKLHNLRIPITEELEGLEVKIAPYP